MPLKVVGVIDIPDSTGTLFDHGAFESRSRRVFVARGSSKQPPGSTWRVAAVRSPGRNVL